MSFWAYMIQCGDRTFYVGHTNDLEKRWAEHETGSYPGYTSTRHPLHLVWSQEFGTRVEAVEAERRLKGWGRDKKLALIRGNWDLISTLARSKQEGGASTSSAQTGFGGRGRILLLHPHLSLPPSEAFSLEGTGEIGDRRLRVRFRLTGPVASLALPTPATPARRDNLWQHTCFEAFVDTSSGYLEFNLSPSTEWAAYSFSGYRENMAVLDIPDPRIRTSHSPHALQLSAEITFPPGVAPLRIGLSAVIEETSGAKSYWALRHPPGDKPDFHHPDCFALELPSAKAP